MFGGLGFRGLGFRAASSTYATWPFVLAFELARCQVGIYIQDTLLFRVGCVYVFKQVLADSAELI